MSSEIEFVSGLTFKAPNENAPEYVKAKGWIRNADLIAFLQARIAKGEESTNFDVKVSQGGKWYAALDNWKPQGQGRPKEAPKARGGGGSTPDAFPDDGDSIPFISMFSAY